VDVTPHFLVLIYDCVFYENEVIIIKEESFLRCPSKGERQKICLCEPEQSLSLCWDERARCRGVP